MDSVFIGGAAGFAGDRTDAPGPIVDSLIARSGPRFLMFEMLAERTLALLQIERRRDPAAGYNPAFERFIAPILARCLDHGIKIVGNFGGANPRGAAARIGAIAKAQGCALRIAIVEGDDLAATLSAQDFAKREVDGQMLRGAPPIVAANVYLGASPIADALDQGADIVVTGRVADSALALGPLIHAFRWPMEDWDRMAAGTLAGHFLECGAQVTGGYFADPGHKDVRGMADIGYPIAEIARNGDIVITKPERTGGRVDRLTVTEQMLYEIHDPAAYLAPDVVLDLSAVEIEEIAPDRVRVSGARGRARPASLKATVCVEGGTLGEAEISYAGVNAVARAQLAIDTVRERMRRRAPDLFIRADIIGVASILANDSGTVLAAALAGSHARDVRVRFAAQDRDAAKVEALLDEVEGLYCAGPAGGGGVRRRLAPRLKSASCLIEREFVKPTVTLIEAGARGG